MTNPRAEKKGDEKRQQQGGKKKSVLSLSQVSHGGRCAILQKEKRSKRGKGLASFIYPAWSYELAAQEDRILAAWVMAPPIFFYRNFGGGFQWGAEMMTMRAQISAF